MTEQANQQVVSDAPKAALEAWVKPEILSRMPAASAEGAGLGVNPDGGANTTP